MTQIGRIGGISISVTIQPVKVPVEQSSDGTSAASGSAQGPGRAGHAHHNGHAHGARSMGGARPMGGHRGRDEEEAVQSALEEAIEEAISSFDTSTGSASDLMKSIQTAIETTLAKFGIQPPDDQGPPPPQDGLQARPPDEARRPERPQGPPPGQPVLEPPATDQAAGDQATDPGQVLDAVLKQMGISVEEFRQALLDMLKGTDNHRSAKSDHSSSGAGEKSEGLHGKKPINLAKVFERVFRTGGRGSMIDRAA